MERTRRRQESGPSCQANTLCVDYGAISQERRLRLQTMARMKVQRKDHQENMVVARQLWGRTDQMLTASPYFVPTRVELLVSQGKREWPPPRLSGTNPHLELLKKQIKT